MRDKIAALMSQNLRTVIGIDGMSSSGKSTLARELAEEFGGEVIHMDDFFLPAELRTTERLKEPGGNVHYERFEREVALKIREGSSFDYGIFDCTEMAVTHMRHIDNKSLLIVEGAYCLRPEFRDLYDLKVFMKIDEVSQIRRILERDGEEKAEMFKNRWIPLENAYFEAMEAEAAADVVMMNASIVSEA